MISRTGKEAFVWIWLPGESEPIVAGRLEADNGNIMFNYGKSYLERVNVGKSAIAIYEPELPLRTGLLPLLGGLTMPGCIRDAAPDAWGRRVIINKEFIPKLNPRRPTKNWKHLRNKLKDKNLKVCELALDELGLGPLRN